MLIFRASALCAAILSPGSAVASTAPADETVFDAASFDALRARCIGPFRGGRSTVACGVPGQPLRFLFGAAGGGLWETTNAGLDWRNVSDGFFATGSVGAIAVAPSDVNVIYVGMGEAPVRGVTTARGDGVYRSLDGGATWRHCGLDRTHHIAKIVVDPRDERRLWVAAQGHLYGPNAERGVYLSEDGGETFERTLFVSEDAGACDLTIDPNNPRVLYAAMWDHRRRPWKVESGGPGSGVHKSTDGGDTWTELSRGLPELMGKIGVAVSPADPSRVWAIVEADEGGLFRSDDGGTSWRRINRERVLRARAWYYTHITADPFDRNTVWVINAPLLKSTDGGRTFESVPTPHGDNHDLWIAADSIAAKARAGGRPARMINANDGGANISLDGGRSWSRQDNQPTAQFYRVAVDRQFPYRVYGGQQDNSTVSIVSRTFDRGIGREDWHSVGGCESAHVAFDPDDPRLVYAGCYQGIITEWDRETQRARNVMADPYLGLGGNPSDFRYRFNWNAPILASPHDPSTIYHAAERLLKTTDRGLSWTEISPDLTDADPAKLGQGGGPITNEAAGAENYHTILALGESPHAAGELWAGTDDGGLHLSLDGGGEWSEITPWDVGNGQINSLELSPHHAGHCALAVTRYKFDDEQPLLFVTEDYGASWEPRVRGFPRDQFVRVVRQDPVRDGLWFAGTERGLWISFDSGHQWLPAQFGLPVVPVTDLAIAGDDLVVATQGRAFWILDNLTPLRQWNDEVARSSLHLFQPATALRIPGGGRARGEGANPASGAVIDLWLGGSLGSADGSPRLEVFDASGERVRTLKKEVDTAAGFQRHVWDLRRDPMKPLQGKFVYGNLAGPRVAPGTYQIRLTHGETVRERELNVAPDPRISEVDFAPQQQLALALRARAQQILQRVPQLESLKTQIADLNRRARGGPGESELETSGERVSSAADELIETLIQPRQETFQDVINFPNALLSQVLDLAGKVDDSAPPLTHGMSRRALELDEEWQQFEVRFEALGEQVHELAQAALKHSVPAVKIDHDDS